MSTPLHPTRLAYKPDGSDITPEFDHWLTRLSRLLGTHGLHRDDFTPEAIVEEFEAGNSASLASVHLRNSLED